jgi:hypothetical protein
VDIEVGMELDNLEERPEELVVQGNLEQRFLLSKVHHRNGRLLDNRKVFDDNSK